MKIKAPEFTSKIEKKLVCPFHKNTPVVPHEARERPKENEKEGKIIKGMHCPKCFCQGPFEEAEFVTLIPKDKNVIKEKEVDTLTRKK